MDFNFLHIEIKEHSFKRVSQFKNFESIITQDYEMKTEVSSRIQQANREY